MFVFCYCVVLGLRVCVVVYRLLIVVVVVVVGNVVGVVVWCVLFVGC